MRHAAISCKCVHGCKHALKSRPCENVCTCTCMFMCICIHIYAYAYVYAYVHVHVHMHKYLYACMWMFMYLELRMCMHTRMHMYWHMRTSIRIHVHNRASPCRMIAASHCMLVCKYCKHNTTLYRSTHQWKVSNTHQSLIASQIDSLQ
jgi:hypothetical protein